MSNPVLIPLLNPNEPEAVLASLAVQEGQQVTEGQELCVIETTKSATQVAAQASGYVVGLRFEQGQMVRAGDILCFLADSPDWRPPPEEQTSTGTPGSQPEPDLPPDLRITEPALALARKSDLDLSILPSGVLVTESVVRELIERSSREGAIPLPESEFDPRALVLYGGGGHAKMLIDLMRAQGTYQLVGIVDDGLQAGRIIMGLQVLGGREILPELASQGMRLAANAVGGIGDINMRVNVFEILAAAGFDCPALAHPSAYIEPSAQLLAASQVFGLAYVGSQARLGYGVIVNTGAIVSHDCVLDTYAIVSPGAMIAGEVQVGRGALIGMGVTVNLGVKVGAGARLGNGATVKGDVPAGGIVRAGTIWPP